MNCPWQDNWPTVIAGFGSPDGDAIEIADYSPILDELHDLAQA